MEFAPPHPYFFKPDKRRGSNPQSAHGAQARSAADRYLYCVHCRHRITHEDERIAVQGGSEHTFTNPHGLVFRIGCFQNAAGCTPIGMPTPEHTWFAGYTWRIALCEHCQTHLGWWFDRPTDRFCGLIVDRLSASGPTHA